MTKPRSGRTSRRIAVHGIRMQCDLVGEGPPLLLLHGFGGAARDWEPLHGRWTGRWQLIVPDLRGHGRSTNPTGVYTHRQAAQDVLALLDRLGIDRIKGLGVSGGANALLHMAVQAPARIEAMVLVSAASWYGEAARAFMAGYTVETRSPEQWAAMRARHPGGDPQILALWAQARAFADSYDDMNFTPPLLSTITANTLLISGDRDTLVPPAVALEMKSAIPRSALWLVPGGDHAPVVGPMRAPFLAAVDAFLSAS